MGKKRTLGKSGHLNMYPVFEMEDVSSLPKQIYSFIYPCLHTWIQYGIQYLLYSRHFVKLQRAKGSTALPSVQVSCYLATIFLFILI
jgi:hypothetical protein